jgi:hypothetical protein
MTKRAFGRGTAVAIAVMVTTLPMMAEADSGAEVPSGPWVGSDHRLPRFQYRTRWVNPDSAPGRWGGYRGDLQPSGTADLVASSIEVANDPATNPVSDPASGAAGDPVKESVGDPAGAPAPSGPTAEDAGTIDPPSPAPLPSSTAVRSVNRSGLPWPSGVYARGQGPAGTRAFAAWRGRPTDVVVDWPARQTWDDIVNPDWLYRTWQNTPEIKVFGVAPVPEADGSATMAGCARGDYNAKWRQFGTNIKDAGLADAAIIRLGWEFNGNWYKWQAADPGQFAQCWRQIVGTVEQVAPALRWDWNVNRGRGQSVPDARLAYPGDAYVDIVGVDSYDMWPAARDEAGWQQQYAGAYGLKFWADFAAAHGKKLSVAEWGNYPGPASSGHGGGDNPFYIAKMLGFFRSQGSNLAYEAYFNESAGYFAGAIFAPAQVPAAAAQYRQSLLP